MPKGIYKRARRVDWTEEEQARVDAAITAVQERASEMRSVLITRGLYDAAGKSAVARFEASEYDKVFRLPEWVKRYGDGGRADAGPTPVTLFTMITDGRVRGGHME